MHRQHTAPSRIPGFKAATPKTVAQRLLQSRTEK